MAARALSLTPSTISHALNALSQELGIPILIKVGRNISLSAQGQQLAERAGPLLEQFKRLEDETKSSHADIVGTLRISSTAGTPSKLTANAVASLQMAHHKILAFCATKRSSLVLDDALKSAIDLGICYNPLPNPDLVIENLLTEQMVIAVRKRHPVIKMRRSDRLNALKKFPCVMPMSGNGVDNCQLHPAITNAGLITPVAMQFDDYHSCCEYLRHSNAWSLLPLSYLSEDNPDLIQAATLPRPASAFISLVYLKSRGLSLAAKALKSQLQSIFNADETAIVDEDNLHNFQL
jgi:LysR family nitrogen assimilation transcriptional regulator